MIPSKLENILCSPRFFETAPTQILLVKPQCFNTYFKMSLRSSERVERKVSRSEHRRKSIGLDPIGEFGHQRIFEEVRANRFWNLPGVASVGLSQNDYSPVGALGDGVGATIGGSGGRRHVNKGAIGLTLALSLAFIAAGCSSESGLPQKDSQQVNQMLEQGNDLSSDEVQLMNLRNSGLLKPGEAALPFGEVLIAPCEEPAWHRMERENTVSEMKTGKTLHTERDIKRAQIESAISEARGDAGKDRRPEVGLANMNILEDTLGKKLFNEIFDKVAESQNKKQK